MNTEKNANEIIREARRLCENGAAEGYDALAMVDCIDGLCGAIYFLQAQLAESQRMATETCAGCRWRGRRQKCCCCRRNRNRRDLYEKAAQAGEGKQDG